MRKRMVVVATMAAVCAPVASADTFGTGENLFTIDFVTISGATNPNSGYGTVGNDYRIGTFEVTNDQWDKFSAELGVLVTGNPANAYDQDATWPGADIPNNGVSWYEAAQFVNWLNTSEGHHAAYKFTGTQGTSDYTFTAWSGDEASGSNLYRHKNAFYYLPTEQEWVKAAYFNGIEGTELQTYATTGDSQPVAGIDSNYMDPYPYDNGPWDVGSGSEELNGTFDMMGNVIEWMESPLGSSYPPDCYRTVRGGHFAAIDDTALRSSYRSGWDPVYESSAWGFRVASNVPEPSSLMLLSLGGLALLRKRR